MKYSDLENEWSNLWKLLINNFTTEIKNDRWRSLSENKNITLSIIKDNLNLPWDWEMISCNPNITWEIIRDNRNMPWAWSYFAGNPNITPEFMKNNPQLPWGSMNYLEFNRNLTWDFVESNPNFKQWDYDMISYHNNITMDIISKNWDKFWYKKFISGNPNISLEFVLNNPEENDSGWGVDPDDDWNWESVYRYINISLDEFNRLTEYGTHNVKWGKNALSDNKSITWEFIVEYPNKPWDWKSLSKNPSITWEIIQSNPDKPWDWYTILANPNITEEIIRDNPDKLYSSILSDGMWISMNKNITPEIILENPKISWDWDKINKNSMKLGKIKWINKQRLKNIKAFQIQRHWRYYSCNPEYKLAQKLLLRLHES